MNASKISSRYIFVIGLLLLSSARINAGDSLTPTYIPSQQPIVQFPATPMSSNTSLLDLNSQPQKQQPAPISVGLLLQPLRDIKFETAQDVHSHEISSYVAKKNGVEVILDDSRSYSQITLYQNPTMIYPHETVNPDGSKKAHNGEMIVYDNTSVGSDYMVSQHNDAQVVVTPLRAYYTLADGGIVEIKQVPFNYFKAQGCGLSTTLGANGISSSVMHVDFSNNSLTSWHDIQTNLLTHMPQLKTLILDKNPFFGSCVLKHDKLEVLRAAYTNTVACNLNFPAARLIDLSDGNIVQCNANVLICAPGAQINLRGNPLMVMPNVIAINKQKLQLDLRETPLSIENVRPMLTPMLKLRSLINPYVYRASEAVRIGSLYLIGTLSLCIIVNESLHSCKGAQQKNGSLLVGMIPFIFTAGSISLAQKLLGVTTTPKTIVCDDGCIYASYTIEKTSEQQKELKALPWYFSAAQ